MRSSKNKLFKKCWIRMETVYKTSKIIYDMFNTKREQRDLAARELYCASRIRRRLRKRLRRYGNTQKKRDQTKERHSFLSVINFLYEPCMFKSKGIVKNFLKLTADHEQMYSKFINFHNSVRVIISFYKQKLIAKKFRYEFLLETWSKVVTDITKNSSPGK